MAFSYSLRDEAQANCFFNSSEHGLLCACASPCVFYHMGVHMYSDTITVAGIRGCRSRMFSHFVFSINMLFDVALKPHCDLFSRSLRSEVGKYQFCFPLLILSKLLNVTLGDVCVIQWNEEDNDISSLSVSYHSLGQYKMCYLSSRARLQFFTTKTMKRRNHSHPGTDMSDADMEY